jgi:hypothetical protein
MAMPLSVAEIAYSIV